MKQLGHPPEVLLLSVGGLLAIGYGLTLVSVKVASLVVGLCSLAMAWRLAAPSHTATSRQETRTPPKYRASQQLARKPVGLRVVATTYQDGLPPKQHGVRVVMSAGRTGGHKEPQR